MARKKSLKKFLNTVATVLALPLLVMASGLLTFRSAGGLTELTRIMEGVWKNTASGNEIAMIPELFLFQPSTATLLKLGVFLIGFICLLIFLNSFRLKWIIAPIKWMFRCVAGVRNAVRDLRRTSKQISSMLLALCHGIVPSKFQNSTVAIIYVRDEVPYVWASAASESKTCCQCISKFQMLGTNGKSLKAKPEYSPRLWFHSSGKVTLTTRGCHITDEKGSQVSSVSIDKDGRYVKLNGIRFMIRKEERDI